MILSTLVYSYLMSPFYLKHDNETVANTICSATVSIVKLLSPVHIIILLSNRKSRLGDYTELSV